jgi:chemotaxis protein MotA
VLEKQTKSIKDPFMKKGVQLLVDGVDMNHIRIIMETDIAFIKTRHNDGAEFFLKMGGYSPTLGIIGTVMGLIFMLANLSDPGSMGPAIASAFIATLYVVSFANLLYLPIGSKLKNISGKEILEKRIMLEGLLAIQAGDNPRIIEERLLSFIPPKKRDEGRSKKAAK